MVHLLHRLHRGEGDAAGLALVEELGHGVGRGPLGEVDVQDVLGGVAAVPVGEDLEGRPFRRSHELDQTLPLVLLDRDDEDGAVGDVEDLPRVDEPDAEAVGHLAPVRVADEGRLQDPGDVGHLTEVDLLAHTGAFGLVEGSERGGGGGDARRERRLVAVGLQGREVLPRGCARGEIAPAPAVHRRDLLRPVPGVRTGEAERGDGAHHEVGSDGGELLGAGPARPAEGVIGDHDVGAGRELEHVGGTLGRGVVRHDGALVRVEIDEEAAGLGVGPAPERAPVPRRVALGGLDLDHVRAEVGHELGGVRDGHHLTQLQHPHAVEAVPLPVHEGSPR